MNTQKVTVNGRIVAVGAQHFKLMTMVRSIERHDEDGSIVTTHELAIEGVDALGKDVTQFVPPIPLKSGDIVQVQIGEMYEA